MECVYNLESNRGELKLYRCTICTRRRESRRLPHEIHRTCPGFEVEDSYRVPSDHVVVPPPAHGPGTQLKAIFASLGINPKSQCQCNEKSAWMNRWGVDGCRERRDIIVGWLRDSKHWFDSEEVAKAAYMALRSGLAFKLNPLDLFGSVVDLAIEQAASDSADMTPAHNQGSGK